MGDNSTIEKIGLFTFLLIYIFVISFVTSMFSASAVSTTIDMSDVHDPGNLGDPISTAPTFIGIVIGMLTALFQIMTFQVTFVPWFIQLIFAIPCYIFILVLLDIIIDVANLAINAFNAAFKWI